MIHFIQTLLAGAVLASLSLCFAPAADQKAGKAPKLSADEQEILDLTNKERKKHDLPPLRPNALLLKAARQHTRNMARQTKMAHVLDGKGPADRVRAAGYRYSFVGENVGYGASPEQMVQVWMKSKPHRANILNKRYADFGVGVAKDEQGRPYYTQVFGARR
jgi:uncharacterized protein YkwD